MKKVMLLTIFAALMMISSAAVAQTTASGTLTVTATVTGSINLVFNSDASGLALSSGAGTNAATLAFGNVSAFGAISAGIVRSTTATNFTVSSAVDVLVTKTNSASANYTLESAAGLGGRSEHLDASAAWQLPTLRSPRSPQPALMPRTAISRWRSRCLSPRPAEPLSATPLITWQPPIKGLMGFAAKKDWDRQMD